MNNNNITNNGNNNSSNIINNNAHANTSTGNNTESEIFTDTTIVNDLIIRLNEYRQKGLFTDVVLCVGQEEIPCHKVVLCASSPYFEAMFSAPFREELDSRVTLEDVSPWVVRRLLDFAYSGRIDVNCSNVEELLRAASRLQYDRLLSACSDFMMRRLDAENVIGVHLVAGLLSLGTLETEAWTFWLNHFGSVTEKSDWLALSFEEVQRLVREESIEVRSEEIVYNAVKRWVEFEVDDRLLFFSLLLKDVRLPHLSEVFLKRQLSECLLLKESVSSRGLLEEALEVRKAASDSAGDLAALAEEDSVTMASKPVPYNCPPPRPSTVKREVLLAVGGMEGGPLRSIEVMEASRGGVWSWTEVTRLPNPVVWGSVCAVGNDLFVFGGLRDSAIVGDVWRYRCDEERWDTCSPMPVPRAFHSCACIGGKVLLFGGVHLLLVSATSGGAGDRGGSDGLQYGLEPRQSGAWQVEELGVEQIDCYDPESDTWHIAGQNPVPRKEGTAVVVAGGSMILEMGGLVVPAAHTPQRNAPAPSQNITIHRLESNTALLTLAASSDYIQLPRVLRSARCVTRQKGALLYILWEESGTFAVFNLPRNSIVFLAPFPPVPRPFDTAMACFQGAIVVVGGLYRARDFAPSSPSSDVWSFDPDTNTWTKLPNGLFQPRGRHALISLKM